MNERIKELAGQATVKGHWSVDEGRYLINYVNQEKFAELIIRECELVVADQLTRDGDANDEWDRGYISGMWAATRYMKEHFGVEE